MKQKLIYLKLNSELNLEQNLASVNETECNENKRKMN